MPGLSLDLDDEGGRFPVRVGSTITIKLPESPTTGYRWDVEDMDPTLLRQLGSEFELKTPATFGSGGTRLYSFLSLKEGVVELILRHWQPWEGLSSVPRRFRVILVITDDPHGVP